jgi:hypothetical protein
MGGKQAEHCCVEQYRNADRQIELLVGHHSLLCSAWVYSRMNVGAR